MATNESCKVDVNKVSNGVIVFVTSPKKEVVDSFEKEFAAMTASHSK
jgi:phosphohistidine swiveling domain-containing protein